MRVLLIALLAAISYAQTVKTCENPSKNIYASSDGCENAEYCNFSSLGAVSGTCESCPSGSPPPGCSTLTFTAWQSFFACAARCESNLDNTNPTEIDTEEIVDVDTSDGKYWFAHPFIDECEKCTNSPGWQRSASSDYRDPCGQQQCINGVSACLIKALSDKEGDACQFPYTIQSDSTATEVWGTCQLGVCVVDEDGDYGSACTHPNITLTRVHSENDCTDEQGSKQIPNFKGASCWEMGNMCISYGPGLHDFSQTVVHHGNDVIKQWWDEHDRCLIGEEYTLTLADELDTDKVQENCVISQSGAYTFGGLDITYIQNLEVQTNGRTDSVALIFTSLLNVQLEPKVYCTEDESCNVEFTYEASGDHWCDHSFKYCGDPPATTHGDPIVWTFDEECYDLNKDGLYIASEAHMFDHAINIAVYNDYMREIQVIDRKNGEMMLSLNNLGEVINNNYPYYLSEQVKDCPPDMPKECPDTYIELEFDAQDFRYYVQVVRHDYADAGLKEGDLGFHLDIYPKPYQRGFQKHKKHYKGLYFENPLPEVLPYCPGGSPRAYRK